MLFTKVTFLAIASLLASASPVPGEEGIESNCNDSIGNCYDNGCEGNPTTLVCVAGPYIGCPCGYNCQGKGPCNYDGCNGSNGRCTGNYLGCACY
ncbi:hypothetical protein VTK73DRAFT_4564 [Phialemonium thermophilum]|uniref:Uncharacterized protein n=1 Tax=Phialemonium thermophilum TaxID=223376 RepID=A0ABR3WSL5_9PEZI